MLSSVAFLVRPRDDTDVVEVIPVVDDATLVERVAAFEQASGMEPSGGYGGLVPANFRFGNARTHYLGQEGAFLDEDGKLPLLACECGEWGCWPFLARIEVDDRWVTWKAFAQPHRPQRDYSSFGPFAFDRGAYEAAVATIAVVWDSESRR